MKADELAITPTECASLAALRPATCDVDEPMERDARRPAPEDATR